MESHDTITAASPSSRFLPTVCLQDWWLIKAEKDFEGKRLAVAGRLPSVKQQAVRVFSSAPIIKRYDVFTLGTADGICIVIKGLINKSRTIENGFSSEVFSHFLFGFPPFWEEYAEKYVEGESTGVASRSSGLDELTIDSGNNLCNPSMKNSSPNKYNTEERHDNGEDILVTPSKVDMDMDKVDVIPSKSGSNRTGTSLKNLQGNQEEKPQSASSYMKDKIESGTSRKNAKRKLKYDTHVSALTRERKKKTSIVSPESMGFKRSRSGRLLVPTLDFWRNQMAVYDADRQITGIQKGLHVEEPSRGSKSVPQKKRRQLT